MTSALAWLTSALLCSAASNCFAASFKLNAADWVRRWEQKVPYTSGADESKNTVRELLKHADAIGRQAADDLSKSRSSQCGYQACYFRFTFGMGSCCLTLRNINLD